MTILSAADVCFSRRAKILSDSGHGSAGGRRSAHGVQGNAAVSSSFSMIETSDTLYRSATWRFWLATIISVCRQPENERVVKCALRISLTKERFQFRKICVQICCNSFARERKQYR